MKTRTILVVIVCIALIAFVVWPREKGVAPTTSDVSESVVGCYTATIGKDVYSMNIQNQTGLAISGTLAYNNFEKDSSRGTLDGIYDGSMLIGDYSFSSEGMDSVAQVVFKKVPEGFVRGFGATQTVGNKEMLVDTTNLSYDNSPTFVKTECK